MSYMYVYQRRAVFYILSHRVVVFKTLAGLAPAPPRSAARPSTYNELVRGGVWWGGRVVGCRGKAVTMYVRFDRARRAPRPARRGRAPHEPTVFITSLLFVSIEEGA